MKRNAMNIELPFNQPPGTVVFCGWWKLGTNTLKQKKAAKMLPFLLPFYIVY